LLTLRWKDRQVTPRDAAEIMYAQQWRTANVPQQRLDVLLHIVVARARPEFGCAFVVVLERLRGDKGQFLAKLCHRDPSFPVRSNVLVSGADRRPLHLKLERSISIDALRTFICGVVQCAKLQKVFS